MIFTGFRSDIKEILSAIDILAIPPKDPSALAKTVVRVLNDKELARSMGLSARKKVEQEFSVDRLAFRKSRPLGRGQGELYKNVYLPYREAPPFKAGSFKRWWQKLKRSICLF